MKVEHSYDQGIILPETFSILNPENGFNSEKLKDLESLLSLNMLAEFDSLIERTRELLKYSTEELKVIKNTINRFYVNQIDVAGTQKCYYDIHKFIITYRFFKESIKKKLDYNKINNTNGEVCWCIIFILNLEVLIFNFDAKNLYNLIHYKCLENLYYTIIYYFQYPLDKDIVVEIEIKINPQHKKVMTMRHKNISKFQEIKLEILRLHKQGYSKLDIIYELQTREKLPISIENLENTVYNWISEYKKFKKIVIEEFNKIENKQLFSMQEIADKIYNKLHHKANNKHGFSKNLEDESIFFEILEILNSL